MQRKRGSILIVVMFVLTVFALVALSLTYRAALERRSARNRAVTTQLEANVSSAVSIAVARLPADGETYDSLAQPWHTHADLASEEWMPEWSGTPGGQAPECVTDYQVIAEESKLNLLYASSAALKELGMSDEQISDLFVWMNIANAGPQGADDTYYLGLPTPYRCKNRPVEILDELLLIRGFNTADYLGESRIQAVTRNALSDGASRAHLRDTAGLGWLDLVTCCGDGRIDINTAPEAVLRTLPLSDRAVGQIMAFRSFDEMSSGKLEDHVFKSSTEIDQLQGLTESDRDILKQCVVFRSHYFRIFAQSVHVPTGLAVRREVLVMVDGGRCQVLQWKAGS